MNGHFRSTLILGSLLLAAGCEQSTAPDESKFIPTASYVSASSVKLETRISGVAWDPEAFFMSLAFCGQGCPMPPFLNEGIPLYLRSAVRNASISAFDPVAGAPVGSVTSDPRGIWELPGVPSRSTAPYFMLATGSGELPTEQIGPPFPPTPPTQYLPTLTLRPIMTTDGTCISQEAVHIGRHGILEAVAKYLTVVQGRSTVVTDLIDPTRYHSVAVLGFFHAGNSSLRAPADGIGVEVEGGGQVYYIDWAPPGVPPADLRSTRGFIVTDTPSPVGFAVVLVPATGPRPLQLTYKVADPKTDAVSRRPWNFPPVTAPPAPGIVTFIGMPMRYAPPAIPLYTFPPPPSFCVPM